MSAAQFQKYLNTTKVQLNHKVYIQSVGYDQL